MKEERCEEGRGGREEGRDEELVEDERAEVATE